MEVVVNTDSRWLMYNLGSRVLSLFDVWHHRSAISLAVGDWKYFKHIQYNTQV